LRDQVIYPHSKLQMLRKRVSDADIKRLLEEVSLDYLLDREGGLDVQNDWNDVLSGNYWGDMIPLMLYYRRRKAKNSNGKIILS